MREMRAARRGRGVRQSTTAEVAIVVAAGLAVLLGGLAPALAERAQSTQAVGSETVLVREGDNLWSIAQVNTPAGGDVRERVGAILAVNDLAGGLVPGAAIAVPTVPGESQVADR